MLALLAVCAGTSDAGKPQQSATDLTCEYLVDPIGIDTPQPKVSWKITASGRGNTQSAYQIQVASGSTVLESGKPNVWDSGKVSSSNNLHIPILGESLNSGAAYHWRVKVWDGEGQECAWSKAATFEMGLLHKEDWKAEWIAAPLGGNGYHSEINPDQNTVKWVQIDLDKPQPIHAVKLFPARPYNWNEDTPGFGFPVRYRVEISDDPDFKTSTLAVDHTTDDQPNPKDTPVSLEFAPITGRCVRLTATRLYTRADGQKLIALAELQVIGAKDVNLAEGQSVTALDSIEDNGWSKSYLTEGMVHSVVPSSAAPLFRKDFSLAKPVRRARAYVVGLGYYELRLNGAKVGDKVLDPAYTNFGKRVLYSTYDVTRMLKVGPNAVGAIMGKGWYGQSPTLRMQINVDFEDGSHAFIITDDTWKRGESPIVENSLYNGETYDAQLEQNGWDKPGFKADGWEEVLVQDSPTENLSAEMIQPIRVTDSITLKSMKQIGNVQVFDYGQNFSGWAQIRMSGPKGQTVKLRFAELLYPDGTVNQENLRSAKATDTYVFKGTGEEVWEPRFTYHGFRYVQLEGFAGHPEGWHIVKGRVVHTDFPKIGSFECSNPLINQIQHNSEWGFKTNFHSVPTDCPQRDERQGWMGDAGMTSDMGCYNFGMGAAYSKYLQDIQDSQGDDGRIPDTVPHLWGTESGDPMWSAAYHFIVWDLYRHTGNKQLLIKHYPGMKKYLEMVRAEAGDSYIHTRNNYGDWVGIVETPKDLISTGCYYLVAQMVGRIAGILGKNDDKAEYETLRLKIADAFNKKFLETNTGVYGNGSQYSYIWPLFLQIVPKDQHQKVLDNLVKDIMVTHNGHLSTGFLGARYLFHVLCDEGRQDVAYSIMNQKDYPSYGYMLEKGATTIWELWSYETGNGMNSHNHPAFGFISGWFYSHIAGIVPGWEQAGFEHFDIKPYLMGDLKQAKGSVNTVKGLVKSEWTRDEHTVTLHVTIPPNAHASVWVPKVSSKNPSVTESGKPVYTNGQFSAGVDGVTQGLDAGDWVKLEVGSGEYAFRLTGE
ncbi:MAG: family 78 glycoside hydrolase catalytic domain [Armatimonadota bacterium]